MYVKLCYIILTFTMKEAFLQVDLRLNTNANKVKAKSIFQD